MTDFDRQLNRIKKDKGFIAALDQSGGSTPKTLGLYGLEESAWSSDAEMFDIIHAMRTRIMTSKSFTGERVLAAILFEDTMSRDVENKATSDYLWKEKSVVPFVKCDKGLNAEADGVQLLAPMPDLDALLKSAKSRGVFGTKMRSVIKQANQAGIDQIVAQQFDVGHQILAGGLIPILEPEVDIHCPEKAAAEDMLKASIMKSLDKLGSDQHVMLKLTLPENTNQYADCINHAQVLRVVALSGGYVRDEANSRLKDNAGMIASFSRALAEGLTAQQSDDEFDAMMNDSIDSIYQASVT